MPRPTNKADLILAANNQFDKMFQLIEHMSSEQKSTSFHLEDESSKPRIKNVRDVLMHLYEWHQLLLNWSHSNLKGESRPFLPEPYNWRTYSQMNIAFLESHQTVSLEDAILQIKNSHEAVMATIVSFSDAELFTLGYFKWTGGTTLGSYCISSTSSHYDWAMKKFKKHLKN